MSNARKELYEFGKFRLDVSERLLLREDEKIPLSEKAFDTLCALVRRGNHLVSKDDLLTEIWAEAFVEENNLDKNISILRKVLGERAGKGKFIETVRGHGFRFVAEVREIAEVPSSGFKVPSSVESEISSPELQSELSEKSEPETLNLKLETDKDQRPKTKTQKFNNYRFAFIIVPIILGLGAIGFYLWKNSANQVSDGQIKTIAVLPFKSLGAENRNESLELGMADTLISKLGGEDIIVRPLGSVSRYAALEQNALTAGRELGVETVLDGTIQTADNRIRISAQLFRVSDGKHLWTGQFDEKFTDIFTVQDSISQQVATALKTRFAAREKKHQTENVEAYQLYMKGRFHLLKSTPSETETAISYFEQAIELDPNYALAYAGLADAYRGLGVGGETPSSEVFPKAKAAANRAIEIDDSLAEARAILGHIYFWYDWDWNAAENQYKRALELNPKSADALQFYALLLSNTGRHSEALAKIKRARGLDPLNLRINALEGLFLLHAGETVEAISSLQKTLELDPNYRLANMFAARALAEKGMFAEAEVLSKKAIELSPDSSEPIAYDAYASAKSGKTAQARASLDKLLKLSKTRYVPPYNIALVYNGLGETDKTLEYLERAFDERDARIIFLKVEPKWNNLHYEPRFIDLIKRMKV